MKLRTQNLANFAGLALALCLFSLSASAEDCPDPDGLAPFLDTAALQQKCGGDSQCKSYVGEVSAAVKKYDLKAKGVCGSIGTKMKGLTDLKNSGTSNLKEIYSDVKTQNDGILSANSAAIKEIHKSLPSQVARAEKENSKPGMDATQQTTYRSNFIDPAKQASKNQSLDKTSLAFDKLSGVSAPEVHKALIGPAIAAEAARALQKDRAKREAFGADAQKGVENMTKAEEKMNTTPSDGDKPAAAEKKGGMMDGLMNPSTLLGLAGAGASLLAAMKKNSAVSDPTIPEAPAQAPIVPLAATTLASANKDGTSASQKVNMANDAKKN